jgi:hypothetical protein
LQNVVNILDGGGTKRQKQKIIRNVQFLKGCGCNNPAYHNTAICENKHINKLGLSSIINKIYNCIVTSRQVTNLIVMIYTIMNKIAYLL